MNRVVRVTVPFVTGRAGKLLTVFALSLIGFAEASTLDDDDLRKLSIPAGAVEKRQSWRPLAQRQRRLHCFHDGLLVGERFLDANDRIVEETTLRNGLPHGNRRQFYESGKISSELLYRDGQLDGPARFWDPAGSLLSESILRGGTGMLHEVKIAHDFVWHTYSPMRDGKIDGIQINLSRAGGGDGKTYNVAMVTSWRNGVTDGWAATFREDGTLFDSIYQVNGRAHGVARPWTADGSGIPWKYYLNGDQVTANEYTKAAIADKRLHVSIKNNGSELLTEVEKLAPEFLIKNKPRSEKRELP
jgi:antitoxin component YwqK of YwqJK toxin-antitoxin module